LIYEAVWYPVAKISKMEVEEVGCEDEKEEEGYLARTVGLALYLTDGTLHTRHAQLRQVSLLFASLSLCGWLYVILISVPV
jgi:hypothetical protein